MTTETKTARSSTHAALVTLLLVVVVGVLAVHSFSPPDPLPLDGLAASFSAQRALRDLTVIAAEPRPTGSPAMARVRAYVLRQLEEAGVEAEVQSALSVRRISGDCLAAGEVGNVLARVRGTDSSNAVLLVAHADSASVSPGAIDNGSGTVTLLEVTRALRAGSRLKNDVIVLFADGHETTLLGSNLFVTEHPWMAEVKVAINLDGAWNGPPALLRTSAMNGRLIECYADSVSRPTASSFASAVASRLPGDRDIMPFLEAGIPGLDFGSAMWPKTYHSGLDLPAEVDAASLQHMGDQILALSRALANQDLDRLAAGDRVHFPVLGIQIHHPESWALPVAAFTFLLFILLVGLGIRGGRVSWKGGATSTAVFLSGLAAVVAAAWLLFRAIVACHPEYAYSGAFRPRFQQDHWYAWCIVSLTIVVFCACFSLLRRWTERVDFAAGPLAVWAFLCLASALFLPALSFLFIWPLLFVVLALGRRIAFPPAQDTAQFVGGWIVGPLTALPTALLWVPLTYLVFQSLGLSWAPLFAAMLWLTLGVLALQLEPLLSSRPRYLPAVGGLTAFGFLVAGHCLASSGGLPRLVAPAGYWFDTDTGRASWVTVPGDLDDRRRRIMGEVDQALYSKVSPIMGKQPIQVSDAPLVGLAAPGFEILKDERDTDGVRRVCARITSVLHERTFVFAHPELDGLAFQCAPGPALAARSHSMRHDGGWFNFRVDGAGPEGFVVRMELKQPGPIRLVILDVASGLPPLPDVNTASVPGATVSPPDPGLSIPMEFTAIQRTVALPE